MAETIETFRFEDDYEYKIRLKVFSRILKILTSRKASFSHFLTRKVSTVIFSEGGYALSRLQNAKTSNI